MHINHINGRRIREYGLNDFEKCPDIELLQSTRSYEGEDLLTSEIRRELAYMSPIDLVSHGRGLHGGLLSGRPGSDHDQIKGIRHRRSIIIGGDVEEPERKYPAPAAGGGLQLRDPAAHGKRPPHQRAHCDIVQLRFGCNLLRLGQHKTRIEVTKQGSKENRCSTRASKEKA